MGSRRSTLSPATWQLATRALPISDQPLLMGIINVTPDSFSDGGRFLDPARAIDHGLQLAEQGADILDIGGESTRPYSTPVSEQEELQRVLPVIREICRQTAVPVSIDTSKARIATAALDAGAEIINDVTGLQGDPAMVDVARHAKAAVCVMHMQGTPQNMQDQPVYDDVVRDVFAYLRQRRDSLIDAGIEQARICLDPGIGFGKTHAHNLQLLSHCDQFLRLGCPLLVGPSRKGFIAKVLGDAEVDRTAATIGVALSLAGQGVHLLRVHDVAPVRQALILFAATGGSTFQVRSSGPPDRH